MQLCLNNAASLPSSVPNLPSEDTHPLMFNSVTCLQHPVFVIVLL